MQHITSYLILIRPMETNRRAKRIPSGDKFSFPVISQDSDEFEFGSVTSPASPNSPADHLFSNGKLLPHAFPVQAGNTFSYSYSYSRSTSRASSIGSKDSLMSSRSNSTNSRSSTSTSARTSTSEASERRSPRAHDYGGAAAAGRKERIVRSPVVMSCQYQYGASRRWQLIAAAPALKQQGSRPRRTSESVLADRKGAKKSKSNWFKRNILKSFVSACQECHAIKT